LLPPARSTVLAWMIASTSLSRPFPFMLLAVPVRMMVCGHLPSHTRLPSHTAGSLHTATSSLLHHSSSLTFIVVE
jgi:hypothetical protein